MAQIYYNLIQKGLKIIDDVSLKWAGRSTGDDRRKIIISMASPLW